MDGRYKIRRGLPSRQYVSFYFACYSSITFEQLLSVRVAIVVTPKPCPVDLKIKVVSSSKSDMLEDLRKSQTESSLAAQPPSATSGIPEDKYAQESTDGEGWIGFDKPILYI